MISQTCQIIMNAAILTRCLNQQTDLLHPPNHSMISQTLRYHDRLRLGCTLSKVIKEDGSVELIFNQLQKAVLLIACARMQPSRSRPPFLKRTKSVARRLKAQIWERVQPYVFSDKAHSRFGELRCGKTDQEDGSSHLAYFVTRIPINCLVAWFWVL